MAQKTSARAMTKSALLAALAEHSGLKRQQVAQVLEGLAELVYEGLGKKGPGQFAIPGLVKIRVRQKPAVPEHEGINPFTKEKVIIKAKPARKVVRAVPLKALKDLVS
jgi:nucleoid DNA-binding protein